MAMKTITPMKCGLISLAHETYRLLMVFYVINNLYMINIIYLGS